MLGSVVTKAAERLRRYEAGHALDLHRSLNALAKLRKDAALRTADADAPTWISGEAEGPAPAPNEPKPSDPDPGPSGPEPGDPSAEPSAPNEPKPSASRDVIPISGTPSGEAPATDPPADPAPEAGQPAPDAPADRR
jgi:hypothetical protein